MPQNDYHIAPIGEIYYDFGDGFSENADRVISPAQHADRLYYETEIPQGTKCAKFVAMIESACILYNLSAKVDGKSLEIKAENGIQLKSAIISESTMPQVCIFLPDHGGLLCVEVSVARLSSERQTMMETAFSDLRAELVSLRKKNAVLQENYDNCMNSMSWKITKPLRLVVSPIKKRLKENEHTYEACKRLKHCLWTTPYLAVKKERARFLRARGKQTTSLYPFSKAELEKQRHTLFKENVKFSIVVPLYNTKPRFLVEMIRSVQKQTYPNWELCLADGSDEEHSRVGRICRLLSRADKRIKYRALDQNLGISNNTNEAIKIATGDYISLFDHDDYLHPAALYEVMRAVCEQKADFIYTDEAKFSKSLTEIFEPNFKPDYAPDTLRTNNYICHLCTFSAPLLKQAGGGFRSEFDGSQDYDLILRLTEHAKNIVHIPEVLYYWRSYRGSTANNVSAKPYTTEAGRKAVAAHLQRIGLQGTVKNAQYPTMYHVQYEIQGEPLISIIIPNKDHIEELSACIDSILKKSTYRNYEIIIVENNSVEDITFEYYAELKDNPLIDIVNWDGEFNYAAINNYGVRQGKGEHIVLLNNDMEVISPDWIEQMLMFSQRRDIGAVGAMLYYPDDTVQHAGVILGFGGIAGHAFRGYPRNSPGYMARMALVQNYSAVTAACMMIRRSVWDEVAGLDDVFKVAFNDVDLCMRIRKAGYLIAWTPLAELYHYESKSRGNDDIPAKQKRFQNEHALFRKRWKNELDKGDPYYNPNLTLYGVSFKMKDT